MDADKGKEIALVETAYRLDLAQAEWLRELGEVFAEIAEAPVGVAAYRYEIDAEGTRRIDRWVGSEWLSEWLEDPYRRVNLAAPREIWELFHGPGSRSSTASVLLWDKLGVDIGDTAPYRAHFHPQGLFDVLGISAGNPDWSGVALIAPLDRVTSPPERQARVLTRIGIHMAAALRLRDALGGGDPLAAPEAVLRPDGEVEHAEAEAKDRLDSLREAVARLARARGEGRRDPERALELWQGLVSGTWSLVDHVDTDGRRFVVARKNDPEVRDPRALTLRERQVVHYATIHGSNKLIAYQLGLAPSTVATVLQRAMRKLGARSRAELIRLARALAPPPGGS